MSGSPRARVASLSPEQRQLFQEKLRGLPREATRARIPRAPKGSASPLSCAQERLWFLQEWDRASAAYNSACVFRLRGSLDLDALQRSLDTLVSRHEVFRTRFALSGDSPGQTILPPFPVEMTRLDLSHHDRDARAPLVEAQVRRAIDCPFDLASGRLFRATLVDLGAGERVLALITHHIALDAWSRTIMLRELESAYQAFAAGGTPALAALDLDYRDVAVWQRDRLSRGLLERDRIYWRQHLRGAPEFLELPGDFPRPAQVSFAGASHTFTLPPPLVAELRALGRSQGATLFMTLLAGFAVVVSRWSGREDLVIGSPIAGRSRTETEPIVGCFINTLPLRLDLSGSPSFHELLQRVRRVSVEGSAHGDFPFERLIDELGVNRSAAFSPLVQLMFSLENTPQHELTLPGLRVEPLEIDRGISKLDLSLEATETPRGLSCVLEYRTDLFDAATMERFAGNWQRVLGEAAAEPLRNVHELPLLTDREIRQLVVDWNQTAAEVPAGCIHELVAAQVARSPDATAVVCGDRSLTYRQLDDRGNQLAHHLRRRGVGPGTIVGLLADRSTEMLVGLLGILKAGGAYLPLDPAYPAERIEFMITDSRACLVITQPHLPRPAAPVPIVDLQHDWPAIERESDAPVDSGARPDDLAYVIYTSGSTGTPKGVMVEHRSVLNFLVSVDVVVDPAPGVWLAVASISFDIAVMELWWTLTRGYRIVLWRGDRGSRTGKPAESDLSPARLIRTHGVTHLQCTPSWLRMTLLDPEATEALGRLRHLLVGGEALTPELARQVGDVPGRQFTNMYGPTETTIWSTVWPVNVATTVMSIGRPIVNTCTYVLDTRGQLVPVGVPGELFIGGAGVTRGYLDRPALTAERFVADPFRGGPHDRMYRTGDLVRYRPDGTIEFLGRADHQVKLRGFRIELGEIEVALAGHGAVQQAVAMVRADGGREPRLVVYVTTKERERAPTLVEARQFLTKRLPDYMLPDAVVALAALPLTPNGKIDRKALPEPAGETLIDSDDIPRTELEQIAAVIFADVLGVRTVGRTQNFFDLGGHSLLVAKVVARLRDTLQIDVPLRGLFETPSVATLARALEQSGRASAALEPIPPLPREGLLPASFSQERLWLLDRLEDGQTAAYNVPVGIRLRGVVDVPALGRALTALAARHESLRTTLVELDGQVHQRVAPVGGLPLPIVDLEAVEPEAREAEAHRLLHDAAREPFDLARGPLVRALLARLTPTDHAFLLVIHHIVTDGWSVQILLRDLAELYRAEAAGETPRLQPLPLHFADYASWQRKHLSDETLEPSLTFWRRHLAGAPPLLELPTDRPRPAQQSYRGARIPVTLPAALIARLRDLGRQQGATLYMTLMASFQLLLSRASSATDIVVGTPVASRTRVEVEHLTGFFVDTLVVRTDCSGNPSFRTLLARVRESSLSALAHRDVPFERLVDALNPARSLSYSPIFQVMLGLQPDPFATFSLHGLETERMPVVTGTAQFDLAISLFDGAGDVRGTIEYANDLFDAGTIHRLIDRWHGLLETIAANPDQPIDEISLLTADERTQLARWNETSAPVDEAATVHGLFEAQAARHPDSMALVSAGQRVSYGELNDRANQLARVLIARGAAPGALIGIAVDRSIDLVVALLAVLKSGAAYVPLDRDYPDRRLADIVEQARPLLVLADREMPPAVAAAAGAVLDVAASRDDIARQTTTLPSRQVSAENLAYVLFTSGSTGTPKGVMMPHAAVCNRIEWLRRTYPLLEHDRVLHHTSIAFDVSVGEIFCALAAGAALVLAEPGGHRDPAYLAALIAAEGVTVIDVVPRMLQALLDEADFAGGRALRQVHCGAEVLPPAVAARFLAGSDAVLLNFYGPTETCIDVMVWRCRADAGDAPVPIGRPISNVSIHLLDRNLQPVPIGQPGEICISGRALARGYLGEPDLTAASFVANSIDPERSARLYRTGDIGRYRPDGAIDFLGRRDRQTKMRGMRVELGEIEAAARQVRGVADCALEVKSGEPGGARLIAYVEVSGDEALAVPALRDQLALRLPEYMIPNAIVLLPALPRMPGGKIDMAALPEPPPADAHAGDDTFQSHTEAAVAEVFADLLGIPQAGRAAHFFELGGHSLLGARAVSRLRQRLSVDVPLRALFDSPTVAGLAAAIDRLLTASAAPASEALAQIPIVSRGAPLAVAFSQERLWFVDEFTRAAYNIPIAARLRGPISTTALESALHALALRHEGLRTSFVHVDGGARQIIDEHASLALEIVDLRHLDAATREDSALARATEEARRPFDLASGPLARATLFQLAAEDHLFLLIVHHIVADGWSVDILLRDLKALYRQAMSPDGRQLPPATLQFADVAHWQRGTVDDRAAAHADYWKSQLAGIPPYLELPADRPRPARQSFRGARLPISLPGSLVDELRAMARHQDATLFMILMAAFQVLLSRYSPSEKKDIVVGTPVAGRSRPEFESVVGLFTNMLPLRLQCDDNPTFREVVRRVREAALGAFAHQELPFERLVDAIRPPRSLSFSPVFQTTLALEEMIPETLDLPGVTATAVAMDTATAKFDLTASLSASEHGGLEGAIGYCTDLFDAATVLRFSGHWRRLLEEVVRTPDQPIEEISILTEPETRQLVVEWNQTDTPVPDVCVQTLVEAQVERTPDRIAVIAGSRSLTYHELNDRANQLAHHLRARGIGPGSVVALLLDRSVDVLVALLATLKAGAAYLPLDPGYPSERLEFMLADSGAALLVTEAHLPKPAAAVPIVDLQRDRLSIARESSAPVDSGARSGDLAYVIYTSGSTGTPKGVMVEHRNVVNYFVSADQHLGTAPGVWLAVATISFDIAVQELWWTLTRGYTIVLWRGSRDRSNGHEPEPSTAELIATHGVTHLQCTPSWLRMTLLDPESAAALRRLKHLLVGGEALPPALARQVGDVPGRRFTNMYGPTETTIWSTRWPVDITAPVMAIGRPIANTSAYVLDARRQLVPIGVPGELYIGGKGVTRGYLARPELTAERFVTNPFQGPGERMYRTGDLTRVRADGSIEFLGRVDHQVKVRGYRIELREIEAALRTHPRVKDSVVTAPEDASGERRLVGYVVCDGDVDTRELRAHVMRTLPEYMTPASWVLLAQLPLTPNGKVDRNALPRPAAAPAIAASTSMTCAEAMVAGIWTEELGLTGSDALGPDDDFFERGGHSLAAARVVDRISRACGIRLPLRTLFEAPTVRALAATLTADTREAPQPARHAFALALHPDGTRTPFFFLHAAIDGEGFYSEQIGRLLGPDQPYYSLAPLGVDGSELPRSIAGIASRYVAFIRETQPRGPYQLGGFCVSGPVALEIARQLEALGERVALVVAVDSWVDNVSRRARFADRCLQLSRRLGVSEDTSVDAFLLLRRLFGRGMPQRSDPDATRAERIRRYYIRSATAYVPRPSSARLVHLRTAGDPDPRWRRLSARFCDRIIPGDHDTCVTEHLGALAGELARCLREADLTGMPAGAAERPRRSVQSGTIRIES